MVLVYAVFFQQGLKNVSQISYNLSKNKVFLGENITFLFFFFFLEIKLVDKAVNVFCQTFRHHPKKHPEKAEDSSTKPSF